MNKKDRPAFHCDNKLKKAAAKAAKVFEEEDAEKDHGIDCDVCHPRSPIDWKKKFDSLEKEIMLMQGHDIKYKHHWEGDRVMEDWYQSKIELYVDILEKMKELRKE